MNNNHNHTLSETLNHHTKQRKKKQQNETEVLELAQLKTNQKLIQHNIQLETGKVLLLFFLNLYLHYDDSFSKIISCYNFCKFFFFFGFKLKLIINNLSIQTLLDYRSNMAPKHSSPKYVCYSEHII